MHQSHPIIQTFTTSISCLSIIGSLYIIFTYLYHRIRGNIQYFTSSLVFVLAIFGLIASTPKAFGIFFSHSGQENLCKIQGFVTIFGVLCTVFWTCCIAWNLYCWVVKREKQTKLRARLWILLAVTLIPSTVISLTLLIIGGINFQNMWCFASTRNWIILAVYIWILLGGIFMIIILALVYRHMRKRLHEPENSEAIRSYKTVRTHLILYVLVYIFCNLFGVINRVWQLDGQKHSFPLDLTHAITSTAQGFLNAIIYGRVFECKVFCKRFYMNKDNLATRKSKTQSLYVEDDSLGKMTTTTITIFATTFNAGESQISRNLEDWISHGHDLYLIAVQECISLSEFIRNIQDYLNRDTDSDSDDAFVSFTREIGSTKTVLGFHGYIAITIFVRKKELKDEKFIILPTAKKKVNRGIQLGLGRASNKGGVGFAFQFSQVTFAVACCHFASDSNGKNRLQKRQIDATSILKDLQMGVDETEFDFPLMFHHTILLGDLNFRLSRYSISPKEVLSRILSNSTKKCNNHWENLVQYDELRHEMISGNVFCGFKEADITFPPSYRRHRNHGIPSSLQYSSWDHLNKIYCIEAHGKKRVPSYTDRILYHSLEGLESNICCQDYRLVDQIDSSDHVPVACVFKVAVQFSLISSPIATANTEKKISRMNELHGVCKCKIILKDISLETKPLKAISSMNEEFYRSKRNFSNSCPLTSSFHILDDTIPHSITSIFPIPSCDIFSRQRKIHEVAREICYQDAESTSLENNCCVTPWDKAIKTGVEHSVLTTIHQNMHMAIFIDVENGSVFQGVLDLKVALEFPGSEVNFKHRLVDGGKFVGHIRGTIIARLSS